MGLLLYSQVYSSVPVVVAWVRTHGITPSCGRFVLWRPLGVGVLLIVYCLIWLAPCGCWYGVMVLLRTDGVKNEP